MQRCNGHVALGIITLLCAIAMHFGLRSGNPLLTAGATVGVCYVMLRFAHASTAKQRAKTPVSRGADTLRQTMALVPEGAVLLDDGSTLNVERFFLDRFAVTNRQFYKFVAAGGYGQESLWQKAIWASVPTMVDSTGTAGPQFWKNGAFEAGQEDLPVVGVSWYEADAYARWLGKRLPNDVEWVKAAVWPVAISETEFRQRRYPWGDKMDPNRANLWKSGLNHIVPVYEFGEGMNVGGVYQLIGNVWEWTAAEYRGGDAAAAPMRSIRGGAFDTYFDDQAQCELHSGEDPLHRRHNVGFRCAVSDPDLKRQP